MTKHYEKFILVGSIIWSIGFFLAVGIVYPLAFIGIYAGPVLLAFGLIGWYISYRREGKGISDLISEFKGIFTNMSKMKFVWSETLKFWALWFVLWIVFTFFIMTVSKSSSVFNTATKHALTDENLINELGEIKYFGFLVGGHFSSKGNSDITFSIIGENGVSEAKAYLYHNGKHHKVKSIEYRNKINKSP